MVTIISLHGRCLTLFPDALPILKTISATVGLPRSYASGGVQKGVGIGGATVVVF